MGSARQANPSTVRAVNRWQRPPSKGTACEGPAVNRCERPPSGAVKAPL